MTGRALVVVPDAQRLEQWLGDAASTADFVDARDVCTLGQLVEHCEPTRWAARAPADPLLVRLLLASLAPALTERAFGPAARSPDFAAQTQELLAHLRAQCATPAQLTLAASTAQNPSLALRARALATLWERLDEALDSRGLVDGAELLRLAAKRLATDGLPPRLRGFQSISVHHVHDFFPARLALFEALAEACHRGGVALQVWWPASGAPHTDVFVLDSVKTIEARWQAWSVDAFPEEPQGPLTWLGAEVFSDAPRPRPAPELDCFSAPSTRDEALHIAARVKRLVSAGTPPERIAIAFRDLADDVEMLVEALSDLGVPARGRLGVPLLASPKGRLAFGLFDLVDDGFPAADLADLLESTAVRALPAGAAPPRSAFVEAGLRDDVVGATRHAGAYEVRLAELELRTKKSAVGTLRGTVAEVLKLLRALPEEGPALELLEAWWDCLSRLGLLAEPQAPALSARAFAGALDRALARDQASTDALAALLSSLRAALTSSGLGTRRMTRRDFARHVRRAAEDLNLATRGPRTGAVWLLDARELAGRSFDAVFLGGLVDGRFPGRPAPLPLLSEDERAELNRASKAALFRLSALDGDVRLPTRLAEDRLLLHLALGAGQRVTVSRARLDAGGRELLASPFLEALSRGVDGLEVLQLPRRPVPTLDEVLTEADLRARVALEVVGAPQTRQTVQDARREALAQQFDGEAWLGEARLVAAAEYERLQFFSNEARAPTRWSGQLDAPRTAHLAATVEYGVERPASAAELGEWGQCAFRGAMKRVLGVGVVDAAGEEPDARATGTFWHDVLAELVPRLDREGLLGRLDAPLPRLTALVDEAVERVGRQVASRVATGHPALWELSRLRTATVLRRLVSLPGAIMPFEGTRVREVEVDFGTSRAPEGLRTVRLEARQPGERDVYLRGRIDRIDEGAGTLAVVDYKTSLPQRRSLAEALLTFDFQLPVYLLALQQVGGEARLEAAWLSMRKRDARRLAEVLGGTSVGELLASDEATRAQLLEAGRPNLANAVHGLLGQVRRGNMSPRAKHCRFCDFKPICRISQRQLVENE
jgi:ATP-dependent helicase/nuclease subunit B